MYSTGVGTAKATLKRWRKPSEAVLVSPPRDSASPVMISGALRYAEHSPLPSHLTQVLSDYMLGTPCTSCLHAMGRFSSHSRLHGSGSYRVPWNYGEEASRVLAKFLDAKHRLMPYLYGQVWYLFAVSGKYFL